VVIPVPSISRRNLLLIVGLLIVALAIPATVILVRQRQELRKGAEVAEETVTDSCGHVTLGPASESYDADTNTYTLTVPIVNKRNYPLNQVKIRWETYYCQSKDVAICDTIQNRQVFEKEIDLGAGEKKVLQNSVGQGLGDNCGSLQVDMVVTSINGDDNCDTEGNWADLVWGLHRTEKDCAESFSSQGKSPSCTKLEGPSSTAPGNLVNLTAYPSGKNLDSVVFWFVSEEDSRTHGFCPASGESSEIETVIDNDLNGGDGWSAIWNTTGYPEGRYFVAANVNSVYGEDSWWCTGNPEGPCEDDSKGVSCPNCSFWITLKAPVGSPAPTPPAAKVPATAVTDPTLITLFLGITLALLGIHIIL